MKRALFYEAHPNDGTGPSAELPVSVKCYLDQIDGMVMPVEEVLADIKELEPEADVLDFGDFIAFRIGDVIEVNGARLRRHSWRAIRYAELDPEKKATH